MPKAVSLFTGCGGSDAGVIAAGFDVVMANDILPYARDCYQANLPETDYVVGDISKINKFPDAELLIGCYPCQGFSQGGARKVDRRINRLYIEFARALNTINPKAFIAENVSGLRRSDYAHLLKDQLERFEKAGSFGYNVFPQLLNAHEYGVPQERKRLIIVGIRKDLGATYAFPTPTHGPSGKQPFSSIQEALEGLPLWPNGEFCEEEFHWYYLSRNRRRDWCEVSKTVVANMRHMPLHPVSPKLKKIRNDKWEFESNSPARRFSFREAARLQCLDRRYLKHGSDFIYPDFEKDKSNRAKMDLRFTVIGNAVPPPMFEAVARNLPVVWD